MKKQNKIGFTLVELIVVVTILAILGTIGFVSYVNYLSSVRDSSRIQQISGIHKALTLYATKTRIPLSGEGITILAGSGTVGYQGYVDTDIMNAIAYTDGGLDPKTKEFYTYFMSPGRKNSQLLGYFEDRKKLSLRPSVHANSDYSQLFPRVVGDKLGVLVQDSTLIPLQNFGEDFDILTASGQYISYVSDGDTLEGNGLELLGIIPGSSCKKIGETLGSAESGLYKINPLGVNIFDVYCDMDVDGGGWTFGAFIHSAARNTDVYFNQSIGSYDPLRSTTSSFYSINLSQLYHSEMLITYNTPDITEALATNNLLRLRYDPLTPGMYIGPLELANSSAFFGDGNGLYFSTDFSGTETYTTRSRFGAEGWGIGTIGDVIPRIIRIGQQDKGVYKYPEVWGDSEAESEGNYVFIYVR